MSERVLLMVRELRSYVRHERGRYEGDGDPGCVGHCPGCLIDDLEDELRKPVTPDLGH